MTSTTALVTFAAAFVTVGQLSMVVGKEWNSARRIVADPSVDASVITEHGCVPAQLAGSPHQPVRLLLALWWFFWVKPTTPKQCFLARRVVGIRDGRETPYGSVRPGNGLRVVLEGCEHPDTFVKSLKRGSVGGYRTIALRDTEDPDEDGMAHCVTVRTRGRFAPSVPDGTRPLWLQFDAVGASPRSTCHNGRIRLSDVPDNAIEILLAPSFSYQRAAAVASRRPGRLKRPLLRHNASPWAALAHLAVRRAIIGAIALGGLALILSRTDARQAFAGGAAAGLTMALLSWLARSSAAAIRDLTRRRVPTRPLEWLRYRHYVQTTEAEWLPTTRVKASPPTMWLGSTCHSLSVGRKLGRTDAASSIRHQWHRIAPWFRHLRWLCRRAVARIRDRRDLAPAVAQESRTHGDGLFD